MEVTRKNLIYSTVIGGEIELNMGNNHVALRTILTLLKRLYPILSEQCQESIKKNIDEHDDRHNSERHEAQSDEDITNDDHDMDDDNCDEQSPSPDPSS